MQIVDGVILIIVLISVMLGIFRGFVKESISVIAWILAVWVAISFCDTASTYVPASVESPTVRLALAFGGLFVLTLVVGAIINQIVGLLVSKSGLSGTDRILGFMFGAIRGLVFITVLVLLATSFSPGMKEKPWWQSSLSLPYFDSLATQLYNYLPVTVQERLNPPSGREVQESEESVAPVTGADAAAELLDKARTEAIKRGIEQLTPGSGGQE